MKDYFAKTSFIIFLAFMGVACQLLNNDRTIPENVKGSLTAVIQSEQTIYPKNTVSAASAALTTPPPRIDEKEIILTVTPRLSRTLTPPPETATPIPPPTFTSEQLTPEVDLLLSNALNCEIPCLFGITPGKTSIDEALSIFAPYQVLIDMSSTDIDHAYDLEAYNQKYKGSDVDGFEISIGYDNDKNTVDRRLIFDVKNGIVTNIYSRALPAMNILTYYGMPDEVWLYSFKEQAVYFPVDLGLFYYDSGVVVKYVVDPVTARDGNNIGCFDEVEGWMELFIPQSKNSYKDWDYANQEDRNKWPFYYDPEQLIWDVTDLTPETFMAMFLDPNDPKCISTPAKHWN